MSDSTDYRKLPDHTLRWLERSTLAKINALKSGSQFSAEMLEQYLGTLSKVRAERERRRV